MTRFCVKHGAGEGQQSKRSSLRPTPSSLSGVTPAASNRIAVDILGKVTYNKLCQLFFSPEASISRDFQTNLRLSPTFSGQYPTSTTQKTGSTDGSTRFRICIRRFWQFSTDDLSGFRIRIRRFRRFPTDVSTGCPDLHP